MNVVNHMSAIDHSQEETVPAIHASGLVKQYGSHRAVDGVGLSILPLAIVVRAVQWGMSAPNSNGEVVSNG